MRTYNESAELSRYLWEQFAIICTSDEKRVYSAHQGRMKAANAPHQDRMLRKMFGDWDDPWIASQLRDGFDVFTAHVVARINRECSELFYVNRCESCGRIVATPKACNCGWCGHDWFGCRDEQNQIAEAAFQRIEDEDREQVGVGDAEEAV